MNSFFLSGLTSYPNIHYPRSLTPLKRNFKNVARTDIIREMIISSMYNRWNILLPPLTPIMNGLLANNHFGQTFRHRKNLLRQFVLMQQPAGASLSEVAPFYSLYSHNYDFQRVVSGGRVVTEKNLFKNTHTESILPEA